MFTSLRLKLVKSLIDINEHLFFERRLRNFYKSVAGNIIKTVLDVGANKGQSINFFKTINPSCRIYSFEPNKDLYQQLLLKYKKDAAIKIYNVGISDMPGEKEFHQNVLDYTSTFEELNLDSGYLHNKAKILGVNPEDIVAASYMVKVTTLSKFINQEITETIDVLKIDVEGHEYQCLAGLFDENLKVKIRYIQLEKHNDDMYLNSIPFDKISRLLNGNSFELKTTVKHAFGNIDEVVFFNTSIR